MKNRPNNVTHRKIWEVANNKKLDKGMHIHHIDGNPLNNDPLNLKAVTPKEHYDLHLEQGDYYACILLSKVANISQQELSQIQHQHGVKCRDKKLGIHNENFDIKLHIENIWKHYKPGRKPVTNGFVVFKLKEDSDVKKFLEDNPGWRKGVPDLYKKGLKLSKRRLTSEESKQIGKTRIMNGTHNFLTISKCPHCNKEGKGPMMKRWHFDNCKTKEDVV